MDPYLCGFADNEYCEYVIELLFDNQDEDGNPTKAPNTKLPKGKPGAKKVEIRSQPDNDSVAEDGKAATVTSGRRGGGNDSEDPSDGEDNKNDRDGDDA